ncbi:similar to Saccharomyces cerevisiae YDR452W PPN1 Vacuolar endopolyphosphatase with a role in phosphate metabolism [Maudiozyma saulgeensis]|uniref:Endopolyphosphatase n=1 Tax=Maudiozyma saulgeensis TaxID=1789683 RepID=A0A1X7R5R7_9SACH|nr:similar to Saccharomyces cerevisiae YDR452W PPN1 Vacuolar endopolyphosphatase with a role in phosphate metabolism [Kazachstania saulgeensis]
MTTRKGTQRGPLMKARSKRKNSILLGSLIVSLCGLYTILQLDNLQNFQVCDEVKDHTELASSQADDQLIELGLTPREIVSMRNIRTNSHRKLHGRFLHITDIHPDRFYEENASIDNLCHPDNEQSKHQNNRGKDQLSSLAPRFGKAMSGCDAPVDLMEYTLKWINETLRDHIDFVIWTGDNIRHDNDRQIPRTESQIFEMNEIVSGKFRDIFENKRTADPRDFDIEIVPSLGNNDVFPHNMFSLGPTLQTREMFKIWDVFIPQEQRRWFDRGVTYLKEVIPGKLAVISINTLYLYKANPLVDNCNSKKEPGYQLLLWLGYTLEELRQRNMKVWLSGHVPPILKNFDKSCYDKFTLWTHEYRDIIVGGVYGHMNMDHFIPIDGEQARRDLETLEDETFWFDELNEKQKPLDIYNYAEAASEAHMMGAKPVNKVSYMTKVKEEYYETIQKELKLAYTQENIYDEEEEEITESDDSIDLLLGKKKKKKGNKRKKGRNPTKDEIYEKYSIVNIAGSVIPTFNPSFRIWEYNISGINEETSINQNYQPWDEFFADLEVKIDNELSSSDPNENSMNIMKGKKGGKKKPDKTIPRRKPSEYPLGPAYVEQLFSPTKFIEYYADLDQINKDYLSLLQDGKDKNRAADEAFKFQVEYTSDDKPYSMKSLLVKDFLNVAVELCDDSTEWTTFLDRAFISSGYSDD